MRQQVTTGRAQALTTYVSALSAPIGEETVQSSSRTPWVDQYSPASAPRQNLCSVSKSSWNSVRWQWYGFGHVREDSGALWRADFGHLVWNRRSSLQFLPERNDASDNRSLGGRIEIGSGATQCCHCPERLCGGATAVSQSNPRGPPLINGTCVVVGLALCFANDVSVL